MGEDGELPRHAGPPAGQSKAACHFTKFFFLQRVASGLSKYIWIFLVGVASFKEKGREASRGGGDKLKDRGTIANHVKKDRVMYKKRDYRHGR